MSKAKLTVEVDWDPDGTGIGANLPGAANLEFDIQVSPGEEPVVVTISGDAVSMSSKIEPKLVPVAAPNLVYPDNDIAENVRRVLDGLRDGHNMTRANIAFSDLLVQLNVTEPEREEPDHD